MTWDEWELDALRSADETGAVSFIEVKDWWQGLSARQKMLIKGWLDRRDGRNGGPYIITDLGRERVAKADLLPGARRVK